MRRSKNHKFVVTVILAVLVGGLFGCAGGSPKFVQTNAAPPTVIHPPPAPAQIVPVNVPDHNEGSLWQDQSVFRNMFDLPKARNVGDIVTIKVVESSKATNRANTLTERESSLTAQVDAFLGLEKKYIDSSHPDYRAAGYDRGTAQDCVAIHFSWWQWLDGHGLEHHRPFNDFALPDRPPLR